MNVEKRVTMPLLAVYILFIISTSARAIRDCGSNFSAQEALQRTGYANDVVLPRQNDWSDKYMVLKGSRDMLFCDGSVEEYFPGVWGLDSAIAVKLRGLSEGAETSGCCIYAYPNNEYEYCDTRSTGVVACDGPLPNTSFFDSMGEFGQDCTSWEMLSTLLEGITTLSDVARECNSRYAKKEKAYPILAKAFPKIYEKKHYNEEHTEASTEAKAMS